MKHKIAGAITRRLGAFPKMRGYEGQQYSGLTERHQWSARLTNNELPEARLKVEGNTSAH